MPELRDLPLVKAAVRGEVPLRDAVSQLFAAQVPAIAVLDERDRLLGVLAESDVLRAAFPRYLAELRHTAFMEDDERALDERAQDVSSRPVADFARRVDPLDGDESETHAAERFLHTGEQALPIVDAGRFIGMLSMAALCHVRLGRARGDPAG